MTQTPINQAGKEALLSYAKTTLNLEVDGRMNAETIRSRILEVAPETETIPSGALFQAIQPPGTPDPVVLAETSSRSEEEQKEDRRAGYSDAEITIAKEKGEQPRVCVSCNGKRFDIPRGERVIIPRKYHEILMNAQRTDFDTSDDDTALGEASDSGRFPISTHRLIPVRQAG